jgi:hypothetical protein
MYYFLVNRKHGYHVVRGRIDEDQQIVDAVLITPYPANDLLR